MGTAIGFFHLLPEETERGPQVPARSVSVDLDVIPVRIGWEQTISRAQAERFLGDDLAQQTLSVGEQLARFLPMFLMLQNLWVNAAEFPRMKEWGPINQRNKIVQGDGDYAGVPVGGTTVAGLTLDWTRGQDADTSEVGLGQISVRQFWPIGPCLLERDQPGGRARMLLPQPFVIIPELADKSVALLGA